MATPPAQALQRVCPHCSTIAATNERRCPWCRRSYTRSIAPYLALFANQLAWTFERLVRTPAAYGALRDAVRGGGEEAASAYVEATIHEAMRVRPVIPIIGRRVQVPWRLGEHVVPAGYPVSVAIPLLHHREELYPQPSPSPRSASSASSRGPTAGCPSVGERGAAWARPWR